MIKHIVMWKFKESAEGKSRAENMQIVKEQLLSLVGLIPQIRSMEVGFDVTHGERSMDLCLVAEYDNVADLKIYAEHPEHLKVGVYVRLVTESRVVLDYEMEGAKK